MPNSCSAPRCATGYYNDHSGVAVFHIPSGPQDIVHKWKRFLHRDGEYVFTSWTSLITLPVFLLSLISLTYFN